MTATLIAPNPVRSLSDRAAAERMWIAGRARGLLARGEAATAVEASMIATAESQAAVAAEAATSLAEGVPLVADTRLDILDAAMKRIAMTGKSVPIFRGGEIAGWQNSHAEIQRIAREAIREVAEVEAALDRQQERNR